MSQSSDLSRVSGISDDSAAAFAAYHSRARFGNLDGLRFLCIFMVLWHHYTPFESLQAWMFFRRGFLGVDFFFVLSGFLITTLLLREASETGRISMRNFYLRRMLRIVPVYFFVVTCVSLYFIGLKGQTELLELLPFYYLFLSNFLVEHIPLLTITWSLSVEEQYYMLWPLLLVLLPARFIMPACLGLIAINVAIAAGAFGDLRSYVGPLEISLPTATYAPILMGSLAAILLHRPTGFAALNAVAGGPGAVLLGFVTLGVLFQLLPGVLRGLPNLAVHATMTFCLVALVLREHNALSPILQQRTIARIGTVSYGIYLYQFIALDLVIRIAGRFGDFPKWLLFIGFVVLAWAIAEVSFRTLEAWFQRFRPRPTKSVRPV